jgi:FAD:protein FMN transferase
MISVRRVLVYCLGAFVSALGSANIAQCQSLILFSGATMGTRYTVKLAERGDTDNLRKQVDARLAEINRLMSTYDPESELSRFNKYNGTDWFPVSQETATVVQFALQVASETDGALDPTVGPLVNLWGFGPEGRRREPPSDDQIEKARKRVRWQNVEVRLDPTALQKACPDMYLDLSAVAKGYAVDEIIELLKKNDCADSLVAIGGDIRASGRKPDGSAWQIGVEQPDGALKPYDRTLKIEDTAVSTSGDWRNAFEYRGVRYSHVIDPSTGGPVRHKVASVTVLADTSMQADAWDTALLVVGDERGLAWCEKHKVAAIFFIRSDKGTITARPSSYVAQRIVP